MLALDLIKFQEGFFFTKTAANKSYYKRAIRCINFPGAKFEFTSS